jgi:hypothetical protein
VNSPFRKIFIGPQILQYLRFSYCEISYFGDQGFKCKHLYVYVRGTYQSPFFPWDLQPNSGIGRLHETFRFTSVTRSRTVGKTTWTGDQLVVRPLSVHKHKNAHTTQTLNVHALIGIRTHGPGDRASEDGS